MPMFSDEQKAKAAKREADMRRRLYPRWVHEGRMDEEAAKAGIAIMLEIADDYRKKGELPL